MIHCPASWQESIITSWTLEFISRVGSDNKPHVSNVVSGIIKICFQEIMSNCQNRAVTNERPRTYCILTVRVSHIQLYSCRAPVRIRSHLTKIGSVTVDVLKRIIFREIVQKILRRLLTCRCRAEILPFFYETRHSVLLSVYDSGFVIGFR